MRVHLQWEMAASPEGDAASPAGYAASPARDTAASPKSWICDTTHHSIEDFELIKI
jgi:hypothetical protein